MGVIEFGAMLVAACGYNQGSSRVGNAKFNALKPFFNFVLLVPFACAPDQQI